MNAVVTFQSEFEKCVTDPVFGEGPEWLRALQKNQLQTFLKRGIPTKKEELWKYTDVTKLLNYDSQTSAVHHDAISIPAMLSDIKIVFINGCFSAALSNIKMLPKDVILCTVREALIHHEELIKSYLSSEFDSKRQAFAILNTALMGDGLFLYIPKNGNISTPIHCLYLKTQQNQFMTHARNIIIAESNSQGVLLEEHRSEHAENYFTNVVTQFYLDENAALHYYKIQDENVQSTHIANMVVEQKKDSTFTSFSLKIGGLLDREDINVELQERGASCVLDGLYYLQHNGQHVDNHLFVDHMAEHGTSSMLYKGILDKKSRAVFNGKVFVEKGAQKITASQANHNILLSTEAEIYTKPELEIYADDVKCTHGATVGQLDEEALFYLCSRGIDKVTAKQLLTQAFAEEIISKIKHIHIMQYIQQRVGQHEKL